MATRWTHVTITVSDVERPIGLHTSFCGLPVLGDCRPEVPPRAQHEQTSRARLSRHTYSTAFTAGLRVTMMMTEAVITPAASSVRAVTSSPATAQPRKTATSGLTYA